MAKYKAKKIAVFIYTIIMCVLFLVPERYSLPNLLYYGGSAYGTDAPETTDSDKEDKNTGDKDSVKASDEILPEVTPGVTVSVTPEFTPTPTHYPASYYEKYTTPYVGTGTTPKYRREGHHYNVSIKFPSTYKVENTLYFKVVLNAQLIHVYRRDSQGNPSQHIRTMIMSSGVDKGSCVTPLGRFMLMENSAISTAKSRWMHFSQEWAQYTTRLFYITEENSTGMNGYSTGFLFHSELYREADPTRLIVDEYNTLGYPRSHGCMRLQVKDAKWIYDNARTGSIVEIIDGKADPATWSVLKPDLLPAGTLYDPTDPAKPGVSGEGKLPMDVVTPTAKPTPKPVMTASPTIQPVPTPTLGPTATPELTPTVTPSMTPEVTPTISPEVTPEATPEITPEITP